MSEDIDILVITTGEVLLASSEQRSVMLLKILQCSGQQSITKIYPAQIVNTAKLEKFLDEGFLKLNVHPNNLKGLLKHSILVPIPGFPDSIGLEQGLKMSLCNKLTGTTAAADSQSTLQETY